MVLAVFPHEGSKNIAILSRCFYNLCVTELIVECPEISLVILGILTGFIF